SVASHTVFVSLVPDNNFQRDHFDLCRFNPIPGQIASAVCHDDERFHSFNTLLSLICSFSLILAHFAVSRTNIYSTELQRTYGEVVAALLCMNAISGKSVWSKGG